MIFPHKIPPQNPAAFSLIEVVISLGIIAFAFVGLMGLIPPGLSNLDLAIDATVESQILQHISGVARQSTFTALSKDQLDLNPGPDSHYPTHQMADYFYNEQGEELQGDLTTKQKNYVYEAAVSSVAGVTLPSSVQSAAAGYVNPQVAMVRVVITKRSAPAKLRSYSLLVANNGLGQ